MSAIGKIVKGRCRGTRCDGCGKLTMNQDGEYSTDGIHSKYISNRGRNCEHDFCQECEEKLIDYACSICGITPEDVKVLETI